MGYSIETISPDQYAEPRFAGMIATGYFDKFGSAPFVLELQKDSANVASYLEDGRMVVAIRDDSDHEITAYMVLKIVPLMQRCECPWMVPGQGFAKIELMDVVASGQKGINAQQAMHLLFDEAEKNLKRISEILVKEGNGSIDSMLAVFTPSAWQFGAVGTGEFMSYLYTYTLPYLRQDLSFDMEKHPVRQKRCFSMQGEDIIQLMYPNLNKQFIKEYASDGKLMADKLYLDFEKDNFQALITIPEEPQLLYEVPYVIVDRLTYNEYAPDLVDQLELIGEYLCNKEIYKEFYENNYSFEYESGYTFMQEIVLVYQGFDYDLDSLGRENLNSVLFVRDISNK